MKKSLAWNTVIYTLKSVLGILFPLITFPYISRVLGPENLGKVEYANSISNYFVFFAALGIATYAVRTGGRMKHDRKELSKLATELFLINCGSTILAYAGIFIICRINPIANYGILIFINSLTIICNTIGMEWVYNVAEDFTYITVRYIIVQTFAVLFLFIFVRKPEDYVFYSIYILIANGCSGIINAISLRKYVDLFHCKFKDLEIRRHLKPIFLLFSISIVSTIFSNLDTTMLGTMCGDAEVGLYQAGMKIDRVVLGVIAAISTVMFARVSAISAEGEEHEYSELISNFNGLMMLVAAPLSFGLSCISRNITDILFADGFAKSGTVLMIISFNIISSAIGRVYGHQILLSKGKDGMFFWITTASLGINIGINVLFIPTLGCIAAAISTVFANFIACVLDVFFASKILDIKPMLQETFRFSLISSAFFIIEFLLRCLLGRNLLQMVGTIVICVTYYIATLYLLKDKYLLSMVDLAKSKLGGKHT